MQAKVHVPGLSECSLERDIADSGITLRAENPANILGITSKITVGYILVLWSSDCDA